MKFINIRCIQNNDLILDTANMVSTEEANGKYAHFLADEWDLLYVYIRDPWKICNC